MNPVYYGVFSIITITNKNKNTMEKTLGGDRLGAGKKMKVNLHGYEKSTHNLGYIWRSTMAAGTLVPFMSEIALPGDTFDIDLNCDIKTHPTIGPLFGSYKAQLDIFQTPIRLYNSLLHNNMLGIGMTMNKILFPVIQLSPLLTPENIEDIDNSQINPSCILSYLGLRGIGQTEVLSLIREFNGIPYLAYWEIYKNYYANKQEEIGAVIHTPTVAIVTTVDDIILRTNAGVDITSIPLAPALDSISPVLTNKIAIFYTGATPLPEQILINTIEHGEIPASQLTHGYTNIGGTHIDAYFNAARWGQTTIRNWRYQEATDITTQQPQITTFPLEAIDNMRKEILAYNSMASPFTINGQSPSPYNFALEIGGGDIPNALASQEGLAIKTYQSDLFNNWIQTEWIDGTNGINEITAIDVSGGTLQIDALILARKVYDMLNRIAISGGTYDDWLDVTYDHERYTKCESPMYMGGLSKELIFQEVVSNSQSTDQPLGTLAGKGVMAKKHKGGHITIKVDEPSYIIGIISLTPRLDYSQGNKWDVHLKTMDDLHKPALDEIGFQELITEQMAWWDTKWDAISGTWIQKSAGKQPAWLNYMTNVNQTRGNFAITTNEMFMTLNRRWERDETTGLIKDLTTYIDPSKFNFIFAETALDAQNFWTQISVDITARRKMSAKVMPNL